VRSQDGSLLALRLIATYNRIRTKWSEQKTQEKRRKKPDILVTTAGKKKPSNFQEVPSAGKKTLRFGFFHFKKDDYF